MFVVTLQVVEKHCHVVNDIALPVAEIMRGADIVKNHLIVIVYFSPVGVFRIVRTVSADTNPAFGRFKMAATLRLCLVFIALFVSNKLSALGFPLYKSIQKLLEPVLGSKEATFSVHFRNLQANNC